MPGPLDTFQVQIHVLKYKIHHPKHVVHPQKGMCKEKNCYQGPHLLYLSPRLLVRLPNNRGRHLPARATFSESGPAPAPSCGDLGNPVKPSGVVDAVAKGWRFTWKVLSTLVGVEK